MKNQKAHYSLRQEAGSNVHKLYIYDDVTKYGDFDWWTWNYSESETSAQHFRKVLEEIPETDVIEVHINSNGGDVGEGVAIYNLLKQKKCKELVAYVDGFAWSVVMGLGTSLLIHNMWTTVSGNADQLRKAADDLDTLMEGNRKIYMERVNITEEELESMMDAETYLTAEQAVEQGFADEVSSKAGEEAGTVMQQLQTQLLQLRTEMLNQKAIKTQMLEFCKQASKKNEDSAEDEDEDDEASDGSDEDNSEDNDDEDNNDDKKNQKNNSDPKQSTNKMAALLAKAAAKNLEKR